MSISLEVAIQQARRAIFFAKYARTVTLVVRDSSLLQKMSQYLVHQIEETENIKVLLNSVVSELRGGRMLEGLTVTNRKTNEQQVFTAAGLFIFIGAVPHTEWLAESLNLDPHGFIVTGSDLLQSSHTIADAWTLDRQPFLLETIIPGIFAAWRCPTWFCKKDRSRSWRRLHGYTTDSGLLKEG